MLPVSPSLKRCEENKQNDFKIAMVIGACLSCNVDLDLGE